MISIFNEFTPQKCKKNKKVQSSSVSLNVLLELNNPIMVQRRISTQPEGFLEEAMLEGVHI